MSYRINKQQALTEFKEFDLPAIKETEKSNGNGIDSIMRREAWSNYTDMLCKEGRITSKQYNNWSNPF